MTGEESARVIEHFEDCLDQVTWFKSDKKQVMKTVGYFMRYYNLLNSRVHDTTKGAISREELKPKLKKKADELRKLGKKFVAEFIIATDTDSVTPYINTICSEIPDMSEEVELIDCSGQSLELTNQLRKHTSTSKGGGKGDNALMVRQLAVADLYHHHVRMKRRVRETSWQRNRLIGGHKGKEMKFTKLEVIEEDTENEGGASGFASTWLRGADEFST